MCISHKWLSSFAGDRTVFKCKECGETFWIKTKEKACPKWNAIEEGALQE
jgi:transposase-like protein